MLYIKGKDCQTVEAKTNMWFFKRLKYWDRGNWKVKGMQMLHPAKQ